MTIDFVKIEDVVDINPRMSSELASETDRLVDFIPMAQVSEQGRINAGESRKLGEVAKGYNYFANGDVLLAKITPCMENGKAAFVSDLPHGIGFGSTEFHVLRPSKRIEGRYLFYMLWNDNFRNSASRNMTGSAGQKRVPKSFLARFPIPLPPLAEQKRIADILDKADVISRKHREVIELSEVIVPSLFSKLFGFIVENTKDWPTVPFGTVCESRLGKMLDAKQQTGKHLRKYLRNTNVQWNRFELANLLEMDFEEKHRKEFELKAGDLLVCEGGEIGRCAIWHNEIADCYFQKAIHRVRPNLEVVVPEYLLYFMWEMAKHDGFRFLKSQATIAHLTGINLKKLELPIPPIELQKSFASKVNLHTITIRRHRTAYQKSQLLFDCLVQRAFKGEL